MSMRQFVKFLCLCFCVGVTNCHVRLSFPEPRWPPYDSLKYPQPCGVPMNYEGKTTVLGAGMEYNVTWFQSYAHEGGYRVNLLDEDGNLLEHLTNSSFIGADNIFLDRGLVKIPENTTCDHCIIQIERQAHSSLFLSCADVRIVPQNYGNIDTTCNGRGELIGGACVCDKLYFGNICQYEGDCIDDTDCKAPHGSCVRLDGQSSSICYCSPPYFGRYCTRMLDFNALKYTDECFNYRYPSYPKDGPRLSLLKESFFSPDCYENKTMSDVTIYWRIDQDEIEILLDYPTTSWIGLGWRPSHISADCEKYPFIQPKYRMGDAKAEPETEPEAQPETHPEPEGEPEQSKDGSKHVYGQSDSLTAAYGIETTEGRTIVMFRKSIKANEPTDHAFDVASMKIAWAYGMYRPGATAPINKFYGKDVLKYHGRGNRGTGSLNFMAKKAAKSKLSYSLFVAIISAFICKYSCNTL